ncbi:MAG: hypothetical protein R3F19_30670 [Verrucomicrobiales bacterium]
MDNRGLVDMMALFLEAKSLKTANCPVEPSGLRHLSACTNATEILEAGYAINPEPERRPGQRGRLKRGKPLNLLMSG